GSRPAFGDGRRTRSARCGPLPLALQSPTQDACADEVLAVGYDRWEVVRRRGVKVLVLEDEELFSMLLEDVLTEAGYTVETATNGQEAIERGKALGPDIF